MTEIDSSTLLSSFLVADSPSLCLSRSVAEVVLASTSLSSPPPLPSLAQFSIPRVCLGNLSLHPEADPSTNLETRNEVIPELPESK